MKLLLAGLSIIALLGCSSSPKPVSYYQLEEVLPVKSTLPVSDKTGYLYIEPVQVASFLNGNGLVLQLSEVELTIARQHQWAEALNQQLRRQLLNQLSGLLPDYQVSILPEKDALRLQVQIEQFHALADGQAIISGRFYLSDTATKQIPFRLTVALTENGYPALVSALGKGWQQVVQQIAEQVTAR